MQEEQTIITAGTMIRGRYLVKDLLGQSDSGAVYLVEDQRTHSNLFALKEVIVQSKKELYRSLLEYQLLVRLDHQALAHVHSLLKDDQRHHAYLLMEYIEGSNLETLRQQQPEQRFTWLETMNIMASIIAAVNYLHGRQPPIIHGDIQPKNIIMPKAGGRAILVDFGTAKRYDLDSRTSVINHAPTVRSCYRAPEQYTTGLNLQSDIYSLGATCYTLVTGIVPPSSPSRLKQVSNGEIDPLQPVNEVLPTVPALVARAIDRAISLDADNRFLSAEQFWEALWSLVEYPSTVSSNRPSASSHPPRITEQAVVRPAVVSVPKQPRVAPISVAEQVVEKSDRASVPKQQRAFPAWRHAVLLIVLVIVICLGISADISSPVFTRLATPATLTPHIRSHKPTLASVSTIYPTLAGIYNGTIYDIPAKVRTSLTFTEVRQNQGRISGYLTVGPGLLGYGPFSGTIDTTKHLEFTVTGVDGNPTLFFEGAMQSATSLSGDYYRCNSARGTPCVRSPVDYGLWNVQASSSSGTNTGTNPSPGL